MSGYSEVQTCPSCGTEESYEHWYDNGNEGGICLSCGYCTSVVPEEYWITLDELNEERRLCNLEPLEHLPKISGVDRVRMGEYDTRKTNAEKANVEKTNTENSSSKDDNDENEYPAICTSHGDKPNRYLEPKSIVQLIEVYREYVSGGPNSNYFVVTAYYPTKQSSKRSPALMKVERGFLGATHSITWIIHQDIEEHQIIRKAVRLADKEKNRIK